MKISNLMLSTLCSRLGLNNGTDSIDFQSITIFSCEKQKEGGYLIEGVYSSQSKQHYEGGDQLTLKLDHTEFEVII